MVLISRFESPKSYATKLTCNNYALVQSSLKDLNLTLLIGVTGQSLRHILVVDDEESILDVFKQYLSHAGFRVSTAKQATEVLENRLHRDCDVVISDYQMPGLTGLELLNRLRKDAPRLPLILLSANRLEEEAAQSNVFFLLKPVNMDTLVDFLDVILIGE